MDQRVASQRNVDVFLETLRHHPRRHYVPALYNRLGFVDITALTEKAAADLAIARDWKPGTLKDDGKRGGTVKGFRQ